MSRVSSRMPDQVRELVQHPLDLDPRGRGPRDGGQQHPAVGIARGQGEARLEGLDRDLPVGALPGEPFVTDWKHQLLHGFPSSEFWGGSPRGRSLYQEASGPVQPSPAPGLTGESQSGQNGRLTMMERPRRFRQWGLGPDAPGRPGGPPWASLVVVALLALLLEGCWILSVRAAAAGRGPRGGAPGPQGRHRRRRDPGRSGGDPEPAGLHPPGPGPGQLPQPQGGRVRDPRGLEHGAPCSSRSRAARSSSTWWSSRRAARWPSWRGCSRPSGWSRRTTSSGSARTPSS